jgi:hypothetical protein
MLNILSQKTCADIANYIGDFLPETLVAGEKITLVPKKYYNRNDNLYNYPKESVESLWSAFCLKRVDNTYQIRAPLDKNIDDFMAMMGWTIDPNQVYELDQDELRENLQWLLKVDVMKIINEINEFQYDPEDVICSICYLDSDEQTMMMPLTWNQHVYVWLSIHSKDIDNLEGNILAEMSKNGLLNIDRTCMEWSQRENTWIYFDYE